MFWFSLSYLGVAIGFMMMFIILFSGERSMNIKNFPGTIVSILVKMTGEIEYSALQFPAELALTNNGTKISEKEVFPQFPLAAHLAIILFIFVFTLVIMNLLVGIAVSDITQIVNHSKEHVLKAKLQVILSMEVFMLNFFLNHLPETYQDKFKR